ncbi:MAG TPA: C4-dicarboxylate ABC transporter substrate-binding protein [Desulfovibrio sp.]|nr:C4-dicarboxylate ABC transporter substrate-binding protein [Desulfovibrio sp.]
MFKPVRLLLALVLILGLAPAVHADPIKLTYSTFFPPTHDQAMMAEAWSREVEKRTGGKVKVEFYPGGTLTKADQIYGGVVEGISDLGMSVLAYTRGRFPVMAAVDLPLGYTNGTVATKVANGVFAQFKPKEFDDVQVMYFHAHGPGFIFTKDKPVKTMADLKGLKLRATGNSAKVVTALGAVPVGQPMGETYQSIQKGVVDGSVHPVESNKGWRLAEVVNVCAEVPEIAYTTAFFVVMNKAKWASLPPDVQKTITAINAEWAPKHGAQWDKSDAEGREFFLSKGGTFVRPEAAEIAKWKQAVAPINDAYVTEVGEKQVDGKAVVEYINATLKASK